MLRPLWTVLVGVVVIACADAENLGSRGPSGSDAGVDGGGGRALPPSTPTSTGSGGSGAFGGRGAGGASAGAGGGGRGSAGDAGLGIDASVDSGLPDASTGDGAGGASDGGSGSGGDASVSDAADAGDAGGSGGASACAGSEKLCAGSCVPRSAPETGCAGSDCAPCPVPANGVAACAGGSCAIQCLTGYQLNGALCELPPLSPYCSDGLRNGSESAVDCGGAECLPCAAGLRCLAATDCQSAVCTAGLCVAATCSDGVLNGLESSIDCGGHCGATCEPGIACNGDSDCARGPCRPNGTCGCTVLTCADFTSQCGTLDDNCGGTVDCGCPGGQVCNGGSCCAPRTCADFPGFCGDTSDGCGNVLTCGCGFGELCNGTACESCGATCPCTANNQCGSGFCRDGICCDSACGGNDPDDCRACSVAAGAAVDGTCGPVAGGTECRGVAGVCDVAESCDGVALTCPTDSFVASGTLCRAQVGICDVPDVCSGSSPTCGVNAFAPQDTDCGYSPVFTVYASGNPANPAADFSVGYASRTLTGGVTGPSGWTDALHYVATTGGAAGNNYDYYQLSTATYVVQAGDYIEYDVALGSNSGGLGGIDIRDSSSGTYWRDAGGWVDQNALAGHPAGDLSPSAFGRWHHRRLPVVATRVGATINRWDVVAEADAISTAFTAYYDNFVVTRDRGGCDGLGACRLKSGEACSAAADCSSNACTGSVCASP